MPPKPKKKCCVSKPRCNRCPLRLMAEGRLPDGYTVKKRKLVRADELVLAKAARAAEVGRPDKGGKKSKQGKKGKKTKKLPVAA